MDKNVLIPLSLLKRIQKLLTVERLESPDDFTHELNAILWELHVKMKKLELNNTYKQVLFAEDEDSKDKARMNYLMQRRNLQYMTKN